ncbi:hypothetical protein [Pseudomonas sp. BW7P1]|uniref:hypothetical protein n=1 Tax=Pseudomonas TaxID=286 RepID=UPI0021ADC80A|nr:hypothetical protein [Pseudomonas sp. BW7P1]UWI63359.1 hypothetical protein NWV16_08130 [Pseudomonas sp. BW7P1]
MTSFISLTPAQNRERFFGVRRRILKVAAEPPELHSDNPLLADKPDDDINQLHSSFQGFELKVLIPRFAEAGDPSGIQGFLQLTWDGTAQGARIPYTTPVDVAVTEFDATLPAGLTSTSGPHELSYILNHGGNRQDVTPLVINIDNVAPVPYGKATVPPEVERDGITKKYLDDNGSVLITIPPYGGKKLGDVAECYFGSSLPLATLIGTFTVTDVLDPVTFNLTAAQVGTEEGEMSIFYYLYDRKGNKSTQLYYLNLNVVLTDPPEGLLPPSIPLYDDDTPPRLVDLEDARMPVGVGILAEYTNFIDGSDELEVTVDGNLLPAVKINGFPFYIDVPYSAVYNGDLGLKTITVGYQIKRGSVRHPLTPLTKDIEVDLRRPGGGTGPDNPNPDLDLVNVQGQGGNAVNVLTAADANQTVDVTVPVFAGLKDGDVMTLIWKGVEVPDTLGGVIQLDGTETGNLVWTIEWDVVDAGGNGNPIEVSYKITNPGVNDNEEHSFPQDVDVLIRAGSTPDAKFLHLDPDFTDWFNCNSLRSDPVLVKCAEVLVDGGEPQLADQDLVFIYQGYSDSTGQTEIPNTYREVKYKPSAQEAQDGFIIKIPYQEIIDTGSAWGAVSYSAIIDGRPTPSKRHLVRVHMKLGDGTTCPI